MKTRRTPNAGKAVNDSDRPERAEIKYQRQIALTRSPPARSKMRNENKQHLTAEANGFAVCAFSWAAFVARPPDGRSIALNLHRDGGGVCD